MRDQIIQAARSWIYTPYVHLGRCKGSGVDCIGLVVGVAKSMGFAYEDMRQYPRIPIHNIFGKELDRQAVKIPDDQALPGDMLAFSWRTDIHHIGIMTDTDKMVHSYQVARMCLEHHINEEWTVLLKGVYRFKELA